MRGEAHAETIRLDFVISVPIFADFLGCHIGQQATFGIAFHFIWADILREIMPVLENARLDAIPFLVINTICFTAYMVFYARGSHQIAFVSGVDEHFTFKSLPA
ncbi:hypothetical protein D3C87_1675620 [compost metagenome]